MIEAKETIQNIGASIEELKDSIGKKILEVTDNVDKYGKLSLLLVFIILLIISLFQEGFVIILFYLSLKESNKKCLSVFMKVLLNFFWNISCIISILTFLIGGFVCIISVMGNDTFKAISYLISDKNLESPSPYLFGDSSEYLNICFNSNGDIASKLGLKSDLDKLGIIKTLTKTLDNMLEKLTQRQSLSNDDYVYDELIIELNKRYNDEIDFGFINPDDTNDQLNLYETISNLNENLQSCNIFDTWSFSCSSEFLVLNQQKQNAILMLIKQNV